MISTNTPFAIAHNISLASSVLAFGHEISDVETFAELALVGTS